MGCASGLGHVLQAADQRGAGTWLVSPGWYHLAGAAKLVALLQPTALHTNNVGMAPTDLMNTRESSMVWLTSVVAMLMMLSPLHSQRLDLAGPGMCQMAMFQACGGAKECVRRMLVGDQRKVTSGRSVCSDYAGNLSGCQCWMRWRRDWASSQLWRRAWGLS